MKLLVSVALLTTLTRARASLFLNPLMDVQELRQIKDSGNGCRLILSPYHDSPFTMGSYCNDSSVSLTPVEPFRGRCYYKPKYNTCFLEISVTLFFGNTIYTHRNIPEILPWSFNEPPLRWDLIQFGFQTPRRGKSLCASSSGHNEFVPKVTEVAGLHRRSGKGIWYHPGVVNNKMVSIVPIILEANLEALIHDIPTEKNTVLIYVIDGELVEISGAAKTVSSGTLVSFDANQESRANTLRSGNNGCRLIYLAATKVDLHEEQFLLFQNSTGLAFNRTLE